MLLNWFFSVAIFVASFFNCNPKENKNTATGSEVTPPQNGIRVSIQINTSRESPVNNYLFGMMTENMLEKFNTSNPQFVNLVKPLGISHLQYPGGSLSYYWHYSQNSTGYGIQTGEYKNSRHDKSLNAGENYLNKLIDLAKGTNADVIFVANILNGNPSELAAAIDACTSRGVKVTEVILGVELHISAVRSQISLSEYLKRAQSVIQLLRSRYPTIKIYADGAPADRSERDPYLSQWNEAVGKLSGIDGMVQYQWWQPSYGGSNTASQFSYGLNDLKQEIAELDVTNQAMAKYSPHWVIDQWGIKEGSRSVYGGTMLQFLHICWYVLYAINYNYEHPGFYQSLEYMKLGSSYSQDLINMTNKRNPDNPGYTLNAAYFAFQFLQNIQGANYAPALLSGDKNVMAWYFEKEGRKFIMVINLNSVGGSLDRVSLNGQAVTANALKGYWSDQLYNQMNNIKQVTSGGNSFNSYSVTLFALS